MGVVLPDSLPKVESGAQNDRDRILILKMLYATVGISRVIAAVILFAAAFIYKLVHGRVISVADRMVATPTVLISDWLHFNIQILLGERWSIGDGFLVFFV